MDSLASPTGRKSQVTMMSQSSVLAAARKGAAPTTEFDFNLGVAKGKVAKGFDEKIPPQFRKFYTSQQYDVILQTLMLYFTAMFQLEWVIKTMERARKQHLEGYNPYTVAQRIRELEEEVEKLRLELSPLYSQLILKYSSYAKPQQDRMFFESLYTTLNAVLDEAFGRLGKKAEIEREVGALFRSKHFNMGQRHNQPARSVDTLSCKELYAIKHETTNRALNARMLASLFEKPPTIGVTVASVTNSPLISQYIMSPIVARSVMKDPETRHKMFSTMQPSDSARARRDVGNVFKSAAMLQGVDPSKLAAELPSMKASKETASEIGLMGQERARRLDSRHICWRGVYGARGSWLACG